MNTTFLHGAVFLAAFSVLAGTPGSANEAVPEDGPPPQISAQDQDSYLEIAQASFDTINIRKRPTSSPNGGGEGQGFKIVRSGGKTCIGSQNNRMSLVPCDDKSALIWRYTETNQLAPDANWCLTAMNTKPNATSWPTGFQECAAEAPPNQKWELTTGGEMVLAQKQGPNWMCLTPNMTVQKCNGTRVWDTEGTSQPQKVASRGQSWGFRIQATEAKGLCFSADGGRPAQGKRVKIIRCDRKEAFHFTSGPKNSLRAGGLCLDVAGQNSQMGAKVIMWPCNGGRNQGFNFENGNLYAHVAKNRCLDAAGGKLVSGAEIITWECHGKSNQKWRAVND